MKSALPVAACLSLVAVLLSSEGSGQSIIQVATSSSFAPGGQELVKLDFASILAGTRPTGIEPLSGSFDVMSRNGTMVLRVTEHTEFLIRLPNDQRFPQNFTIEVDIVPKANGPEPDLTLEGTASINQDVGSAHLQFLADASFGTIYIVGGEANISEFPIPDLIRATLPETLTRIGVSLEGKTIRFFINGDEIYPDPSQPAQKVQAQFARGNVLRVTLGGLTDGAVVQPVYLSRLRIATGAPAAMVTAIAPTTTGGTITPTSNTPTQTAPVSAGALGSGPVATGNSPAAALLATPAPRTIELNAISAAGGAVSIPMRTIDLVTITATGSYGSIASRTITLSAINALGSVSSIALAPRTIALSEWLGKGGEPAAKRGASGTVAPRALTLAAIAATGAGNSPALAPRTIALREVLGTGGATPIMPHAIALPGITARGVSAALTPRSIQLPAWTAVGASKTP